ncbi:MAG: hypothetical protein H0X47_11350 [Nitrospirales bacterium]|nr:hypothetical protein [Nitrospirales bacterium]
MFKPIFEDTDLEVGCSINHLAENARTISPQFLTWCLTSVDWSQFKWWVSPPPGSIKMSQA